VRAPGWKSTNVHESYQPFWFGADATSPCSGEAELEGYPINARRFHLGHAKDHIEGQAALARERKDHANAAACASES